MEQPSPKSPIGLNQTVYLVESCRRVREVVVRSRSGGLYTVRFTDTGGGIRVRRDRLYLTREAAQASLRKEEAPCLPRIVPGNWHNAPAWEC